MSDLFPIWLGVLNESDASGHHQGTHGGCFQANTAGEKTPRFFFLVGLKPVSYRFAMMQPYIVKNKEYFALSPPVFAGMTRIGGHPRDVAFYLSNCDNS